jgi:hypothetical protein
VILSTIFVGGRNDLIHNIFLASGFLCFQLSALAFQATNGGFETGDLQGWNIIGNGGVVGTVLGTAPSQGTHQALLKPSLDVTPAQAILATGGSLGCNAKLFDNAKGITIIQQPMDVSSTLSFKYKLITDTSGPGVTNKPFVFVIWASQSSPRCMVSQLARVPLEWAGPYSTNYLLTAPFSTLLPEAGTLSIGIVTDGNPQDSSALVDDVQITPPPGTLSRIGVCSQIASGGGWRTRLTLVNLDTVPIQVRAKFFTDSGQALTLPLTFPQPGRGGGQLGSSVDRTLAVGESFVIESEAGSASLTLQGWVDIGATGKAGAFATFRNQVTGQPDIETTSPMDSTNRSMLVVPYDNTSPYVTAIALVNGSNIISASIVATILDDNGAVLLNQVPIGVLNANGHLAFVVPDLLPFTAGGRGTLRLESSLGVPINALALLFGTNRIFTSIPVM